jgi:hypothetical protein
MTPRQRRSAAYHEAGHAVVSVVLRLGVMNAVVGDDLYPLRGRTRQRTVPQPKLLGQPLYTDERCRREIAGLYAGPVAERREMTRANRVGASGDMAKVRELLLFQFDPKDWPVIERQEEARASSLVDRQWDVVTDGAEALIRDGRVSGRGVMAALRARSVELGDADQTSLGRRRGPLPGT